VSTNPYLFLVFSVQTLASRARVTSLARYMRHSFYSMVNMKFVSSRTYVEA